MNSPKEMQFLRTYLPLLPPDRREQMAHDLREVTSEAWLRGERQGAPTNESV